MTSYGHDFLLMIHGTIVDHGCRPINSTLRRKKIATNYNTQVLERSIYSDLFEFIYLSSFI